LQVAGENKGEEGEVGEEQGELNPEPEPEAPAEAEVSQTKRAAAGRNSTSIR